MDASPSYTATPLLTRNEMTYAPPRPAMDMLPAMPIERPDPYSSYIPSRLLSQQAASVQPQPAPIQRAVNPLEAAMMSRLGLPGFEGGPSYIDEYQGQSLGGGETMRQSIMRAPSLRSRQIAGPSPYYVMRHPIYDESLRLNFYPSGYYGR
jgi:hypothetical protein